MITYYQLKNDISQMLKLAGLDANKISFSGAIVPVPGPINNEGCYYEAYGNTYTYAYFERGKRTIICKTDDIHEFYYCIVRDIIKNYAIDYELKNRIPNHDPRRIWMKKSLDLMKKISDEFYNKLCEEYFEILKEYPFNDFSI